MNAFKGFQSSSAQELKSIQFFGNFHDTFFCYEDFLSFKRTTPVLRKSLIRTALDGGALFPWTSQADSRNIDHDSSFNAAAGCQCFKF
jgi:hypothetical protein